MPEQDNWPEFIYGEKTVEQYLKLVIQEKRDLHREIVALVDFIRDIAKFPLQDSQQTFLYINACCKAIRGLMSFYNHPRDYQ
jgi:hypothetical protein